MKDKRLKTTTVTWILAIVWLITALFPVAYFDGAIGSARERAKAREEAIANAPHNSIEDTVTALIDIDLQDDMVRGDSVFSDILSESDRESVPYGEIDSKVSYEYDVHLFSCRIQNTDQLIDHYKLSIVITCAYVLCGIAMFVVFRKTSWLKYVYVALITLNLFIIPLAESVVPLYLTV